MGFALNQLPVPVPLSSLRRMAGLSPLIVNYHVVSDEFLPHISHLYRYRDTRSFKSDLDLLLSAYTPIGLSDLLDHMQKQRVLPKNSFLLTFDDGFSELYDVVAPILLEKGIPATFFLTRDALDNQSLIHSNKKSLLIDHLGKRSTEFSMQEMWSLMGAPGKAGGHEDLLSLLKQLGYSRRSVLDEMATNLGVDFEGFLKEHSPYLSSSQLVRLLEQGFTIGGHSKDHANFIELTLEQQVDQALSSVAFLRDKFGIGYKAFAFPYSDIGISRDFFSAISNDIDITFGTQGMLSDTIPSNFQRVNFEKHTEAPRRVLKFHYTRRIIYKLLSREVIQRT